MSILLAPDVLFLLLSSDRDKCRSIREGFKTVLISIPNSQTIKILLTNIVWDHAPPLPLHFASMSNPLMD